MLTDTAYQGLLWRADVLTCDLKHCPMYRELKAVRSEACLYHCCLLLLAHWRHQKGVLQMPDGLVLSAGTHCGIGTIQEQASMRPGSSCTVKGVLQVSVLTLHTQNSLRLEDAALSEGAGAVLRASPSLGLVVISSRRDSMLRLAPAGSAAAAERASSSSLASMQALGLCT